jgi:hypothetical protein
MRRSTAVLLNYGSMLITLPLEPGPDHGGHLKRVRLLGPRSPEAGFTDGPHENALERAAMPQHIDLLRLYVRRAELFQDQPQLLFKPSFD